MKRILLLLFLLTTALGFAQVGVNTTNPDASSMLDISATDKGVLFPRVSLSNVTLTTLDGTNTAATGLLIWNTNATTIGGNGVGYYYFNGTIWVPVVQTGANDHDWYEVGTTIAPNAITDNMFHTGNIAIGKNTIDPLSNPKLDIENNTSGSTVLKLRDVSTGTTLHTGINLDMQSTSTATEYGIAVRHNNANSGLKYGVYSTVENGSGNNTAFQGRVTGTGTNSGLGLIIFDSGSASTASQFAITTEMRQSTTNSTAGLRNGFTSNNLALDTGSKFGVQNIFGSIGTNVGGDLYGVYNYFESNLTSTTNKYGTYTIIPSVIGGTHYGIYSNVLKSGSFAGYFLGNVSIGTNAGNNYILPPSRGTNGQTMQTDATGNVTWVNPPTDTDDQTTDVFSLTGTTLNLSLQNDGVATQTVDLSSIVGDDDWTDVGADIERQAGDVYIGDTSGTNNNLYVSNQIIDWDNTTYFLDPATANRVNEIQFDDGSVTDPSITFTEQNTGFFSPSADATAYSANGTEAFRIHSSGNIAVGQTIDPNYGLSVSTLTGNSNIQIGNKDFNDNVMNIFHNGDRANALNVAALSSYNLASRSSISASNALGASAVDIARFESGSFNTYGVKSIITDNPSGIEYGIYSEALPATGFAGYFLGRTSIGTTTANNYILPASRGTNGQIMQTDGSGNVSWANNAASDADWYEVGGTTPANAITDNIYTSGDVSIGKNTAAVSKMDIEAQNKTSTLNLRNNNTITGSKSGINNNLFLDTTNAFSSGILNNVSGNVNYKYGVNNNLTGNITLAGPIYEFGVKSTFNSSGNVNSIGVFNDFYPLASHNQLYTGILNDVGGSNHIGPFTGVQNNANYATDSTITGLENSIGGAGIGNRIGLQNSINAGNSGTTYGVRTNITGNGSGLKYGESITIPSTTGGQHFGLYSEVLKTGSYAGYFVGNVSIGTSTLNNYILPPSRGTNGQIMQTDGSGNVAWVNNSASDADWYEVGGLTPADSILDNIFTGGDVSIGKATLATGKVDIEADNKTMTLVLENNNASSGSKSGIDNNLTANANNALSWGILNRISGLSSLKFGVTNSFTNNNPGVSITEVGYNNDYTSTGNVNFVGHSNTIFPFSTNSGTITGYVNNVTGSVTGEFTGFVNSNFVTTNSLKTGLMNVFSGGGNGDTLGINNSFTGITNGEIIGVNTNINSSGTGLKYGEKISIDNTSGGIHCGIYADVTKANSYAGYFLGRVSIGNTLANNYILPASRGTNGQIMQTDGVGNVSWTNAPTSDADWYEVGGTNPANAITDNIFTSGDVSIGKNTAATAKVDIDANTKLNTLALENLGATVGTKNGISNSVQANANNANSSAILNAISGLAVVKYGVNNGFLTNNLGANITEYGINNNFFSSGNVSMMGTNNNFAPSGVNSSLFTGVRNSLSSNNHTGLFVGLANYISNTTNSQQYGVFNAFSGGGSGIRYGVRNDMGGNSTSDIYGTYTEITSTGAGNKYGENITIDNTAPGTHYGIYADVTKATSYAGYFLGRVSIGTTTADNYILPTSRGTNGQIMQTDGAGNVSWINTTTIAPVGWKIAGNAGTIAGSDYIGTNDAQDFDFRTNNVLKLRLTQQGQLAFLNSGGSVFVGAGAGDVDDLTNNQNTFIGTSSGQLTTIGNLNTAIGHSSLSANVDGLGNTAVGRSALTTNVSGSNNTSIGRLSDVSVGTLTNATAVGFSATVNASNKVRLGSATVTVVEGQVPYTNPSDARFKFNVKEDVPGLDFIKKLKPVTYNFDIKKFDEHLNKNSNRDEVNNEDFATSTAIIRTGFLAQDVEKICNDLGYNFDGLHIPDANNPTDNYGIAYSQFIMPIVKAVQEQQVIIETQKTELEQLKLELEKYKTLEERIKALEQK